MRAWGLAVLVVCASCYHGTESLSCKIRCDDGCPDGMTCMDGLCTTGASCTGETTPSCGTLGQACCTSEPACTGNGACVNGTCSECVTAVALGRRHSCALEHDGTVWCVGDNDRGQLGNNSTTRSNTQVQVQDATGPITDATSVAAGRTHSCLTRSGGTVWCWGANGHGQLGDNTYTDEKVAVQVQATGGTPLENIVEVTAGYAFTCARSMTGALSCWGDNSSGMLGDNTVTSRAQAAPVTVNAVPFTNAISLSTGHYHSCAIDSSNQAWCWGWNPDGEIGDGTTNTAYQPVMVMQAMSIAAGAFHTCAVRPDTSVACWGYGQHDWIGDAASSKNNSSTPQAVLVEPGGAALVGATTAIAAGVSCALMSDHRVLCWGINAHGQVGNGGGSIVPAAVLLGDGELGDVDWVKAGYSDVCAHRSDGSILCWGRNSEGELADGGATNHSTPAPLGFSCR